MNNNIYLEDELAKGARSLVGKTVNWNHGTELAPEVQIYDAEYEDSCVECILRIQKDSKALDLIEKGEVVHVSIEADCLRGSELTPEGWTCKGLLFTGLALLTKDELPGVPLTRIMPVEKLVESFTVTGVTGLNDQKEGKQEPQTQNQTVQPGQNAVASQTQPTSVGSSVSTSVSPAQEAEWDTAYINDLPDSSFAVIEPAYPEKTQDKRCRHLPFKDKDGKVDLPHLRNALARMNQIEPVTDSISTADLRAKAQKALIAAAKDAGVGDYELYPYIKIQALEAEIKALAAVVCSGPSKAEIIAEIEKLKPKPEPAPNQGPKEPCKCVLTKEGFWARFHELRAEGIDQKDAFRLVALEIIEAVTKKSK
jgi:hypothetical protein